MDKRVTEVTLLVIIAVGIIAGTVHLGVIKSCSLGECNRSSNNISHHYSGPCSKGNTLSPRAATL